MLSRLPKSRCPVAVDPCGRPFYMKPPRLHLEVRGVFVLNREINRSQILIEADWIVDSVKCERARLPTSCN